MKPELSKQIFEKYSNIKFHDNQTRQSRAVPCGWTNGQTDVTKLTATFSSFVKPPKKAFRMLCFELCHPNFHIHI